MEGRLRWCVLGCMALGLAAALNGCSLLTKTPAAGRATAGATAGQAVRGRVNVPLLAVAPGDPLLDANGWSVLWLGSISPEGDYTQVRLVGQQAGLTLYVQVMRPVAAGEVLLRINGRTLPVTFASTPGWEFGRRCGAAVDSCRGWSAYREVPWAELGGRPAPGDEWPLQVTAYGNAWAGTLHWGLPDYAGRDVAGARVLVAPVAADASLGGGTDCAADDDDGDFFDTWGGLSRGAIGSTTASMGAMPYASVQNQWDTADWPCYARYLARWSVASLPPGAQVVSATLNLWRFGHSGYNAGDSGTTTVQVYEVLAEGWEEATVAWDSAPPALENVSRIEVHECSEAECGRWYSLDVTEIVRRAVARGDDQAAALLYTAAGQYHSGKYFYTREGSQPPVVRIAYVMERTPTRRPAPLMVGGSDSRRDGR